MQAIYFDNFRGFKKTFLTLKNVNFFVGENSSGKTSVLKLIKILSTTRFWFSQEFNSEEAELGYFSEIASYADRSKKYFDVGVLSNSMEGKEDISAIKLRYVNTEGIPTIKELSVILNSINIQAVIENGNVKYRFSSTDFSQSNDLDRINRFKFWIENNELVNKAYVKLDKRIPHFIQAPLYYLQNIITQIETKNKTKKENSSSFFMPSFFEDIAWLAPIRTNPKRTYDSYQITFNPDGTHAPYLLKKLLDKGNTKKREKVESILQKFGEDSGLFDKILINSLGKTDTSPFELQILLNNQPIKITNVGYGVSQILPLIIEVIAREKDSWFALQQPEIHLHPRGQAAFGDFILKSAMIDRKNFIIETHSDYTIDRFRLKLSKCKNMEESNKIESQIVFFKHSGGFNELTSIPILEDGSLPDDQPEEFRNFFIKEQLDLLQL